MWPFFSKFAQKFKFLVKSNFHSLVLNRWHIFFRSLNAQNITSVYIKIHQIWAEFFQKKFFLFADETHHVPVIFGRNSRTADGKSKIFTKISRKCWMILKVGIRRTELKFATDTGVNVQNSCPCFSGWLCCRQNLLTSAHIRTCGGA